jgi:lysozyme family protein
MAEFEKAIGIVLRHEGGYVHDPVDPGGETKFGISKRQYPLVDIKNLTRQEAIEIYRRDYWRYDGFIEQTVATKVFDMAVNMGHKNAHTLLQVALNGLGSRVAVDGALGPQTTGAANGCEGAKLVQELRATQATYYAKLVVRKPRMEKFLRGWMRRAVA